MPLSRSAVPFFLSDYFYSRDVAAGLGPDFFDARARDAKASVYRVVDEMLKKLPG